MSDIDTQLRERAAQTPDRPALVTHAHDRERVWTWAELERDTAPVAAQLAATGGGPGSVLLAAVDGDPDRVIDLIAMLRTDLPLAVVSRAAPDAEQLALRESLRRDGHLVVDQHDRRAGRYRPPDARQPGHHSRRRLPAGSLLLATSGSTGRPRVVVDTWTRAVSRRPRPIRPTTAMNWRPGQRQLVPGPLYHVATLTFFIEGLADGNTMVLPPPAAPDATRVVIGDWRVEWLHLTPYHMRQLAGTSDRSWSASIRGLVHLSAPCPHQVKRQWLDLIGPERVFEMYGATEGTGVTLVRGDEWLRRPGTVGRGFFTRIRILDDAGVPLPTGDPGWVYFRAGRPARPVYLNTTDRLRTTIDGFASVGDRGSLDRGGYLYLAPRQHTRIQVGGATVDPAQVESVLMEYPEVLDAAVVGVPDERLGESLAALVVTAGIADGAVLRRHLRGQLARYKVPRTIQFVQWLPRTEAGKLDRRRLAGLVHGRPAQGGES